MRPRSPRARQNDRLEVEQELEWLMGQKLRAAAEDQSDTANEVLTKIVSLISAIYEVGITPEFAQQFWTAVSRD